MDISDFGRCCKAGFAVKEALGLNILFCIMLANDKLCLWGTWLSVANILQKKTRKKAEWSSLLVMKLLWTGEKCACTHLEKPT